MFCLSIVFSRYRLFCSVIGVRGVVKFCAKVFPIIVWSSSMVLSFFSARVFCVYNLFPFNLFFWFQNSQTLADVVFFVYSSQNIFFVLIFHS